MNPEAPSIKAIILRHKAASAAAVAIVLVLVAGMVAAALPSARAGALSDSSTCSAWSSGTGAQQAAYARLYVNEHLAGASRDAATVETAMNTACNHAAYLGEADDVSVVAALNHAF
jgi:hypothetical protein